MTPEAAETPLLDLLRDVPLDARLSYEHSPTYHQYIPVGTLISKAIGEIERLRAEVEALRDANERFGKRQEWWIEKMFQIEQENEALKSALDLAARTLRGEGAEDQGDAYDKAQRIIDAAIDAAMAKE